jgi:U3 small nucleolar RNA-associated protein 12
MAVSCLGSVGRSNKDRVLQVEFDPSGRFLAVASDRYIEFFKMRTEDEWKRKLRKKKKQQDQQQQDNSTTTTTTEPTLTASLLLVPHRLLRLSSKIRSFAFPPPSRSDITQTTIMVTLTNNSIEMHNVSTLDTKETSVVCSLDMQGHRSDVRSIVFSSDDEVLMTCSSDTIKLWNTQTHQCLRTITTTNSSGNNNGGKHGAYIVSSVFVPGNRFLIVGTKKGELLVYDAWSAQCLETVKAHEGTIWTIDVRPDKKGIVTGGADKDVKFWDFGAIEDEEYSTVHN